MTKLTEQIVAKNILAKIRSYLDDPNFSDEEKLDYIMVELGTKLSDLMSKAAYPIEPLCLHVAKQLLFSNWGDWTKEMANTFLDGINWYLGDIKEEGFKIDFIEDRFELKSISKATRILNKAVNVTNSNARKSKLPEVPNDITPEQFIEIWEGFYKDLLPKLGTEHDFTEEDVRQALDKAVKKAGLRFEFRWE